MLWQRDRRGGVSGGRRASLCFHIKAEIFTIKALLPFLESNNCKHERNTVCRVQTFLIVSVTNPSSSGSSVWNVWTSVLLQNQQQDYTWAQEQTLCLRSFGEEERLQGPEAAEPTQTITVPPPCLAPQDHRGATGLSVIGSSKTLWWSPVSERTGGNRTSIQRSKRSSSAQTDPSRTSEPLKETNLQNLLSGMIRTSSRSGWGFDYFCFSFVPFCRKRKPEKTKENNLILI